MVFKYLLLVSEWKKNVKHNFVGSAVLHEIFVSYYTLILYSRRVYKLQSILYINYIAITE